MTVFKNTFWIYTTGTLISGWILIFSFPVYANNNEMSKLYASLKPVLEKNIYGLPIYIHSTDENNTMSGSIYGVISHSFDVFIKAIRPAKNWCQLAPLHLNVKACTYRPLDQHCQLTFYSGRKFYEKADDVYQLSYLYQIEKQTRNFMHLRLSAEDGPAGTSQYQLDLKIIPVSRNESFVHFRYAYHYNLITSMGMNTYLATLGSDKLGFSITGHNEQGHPVYIQGVRGIIERNSVRYYLAIKAYLDTLNETSDKRFNARLNNWFDLTEKYHKQLYEMEKKDYLSFKHREREDQLRLQGEIQKSASANLACD